MLDMQLRGNSSRDCPKRTPGKKVNIVEEEQPTMWIKLMETNQDDEYAPVRRGNRMRPAPKLATLGDFVLSNTFAQLQSDAGAGASSGKKGGAEPPRKDVQKLPEWPDASLLCPSPGPPDTGRPARPTRLGSTVLASACGASGQQEPGGKRAAVTGRMTA